ncbi:beta-propeller domain-containing protein [Terriglobus albidus]|uniref:beta-propeller domain-containing protein n=1 Tax=Terriglobus albidus TaxID=1592106 RepID=UPI0021E0EE82|nr:hypothetical protein [Terriglobus albidus]
MFPSRSLGMIFVVLWAYGTQAQVSAPSSISLPGKGLAGHDFLYAGESRDRKVFLIRRGKIDWNYDDPQGKGEISDAVLLSSGNLLIAHQYGVKLISPEKKILWSYDPPAGHEVHTAVPIGASHVLYIQNGDPSALLRVVNTNTGAVEKELTLAVKHPVHVHTQFRHARLTVQGTLLVAHMDLNKVVEYDAGGNELWSFPATSPWGVSPLENGNVLITDRVGVREVTRRGDTVWSFTPAEAPEYHFTSLQQAWRLPNGNTVINNWVNEWSKNYATAGPHTIQAIEVTPEKEVVWALREWDPPTNLGPSTTLQFLDQPSAPEAVHFGEIQ